MLKLSASSYATPLVGFRSRKAAQLCAYFAGKNAGTIEKLKLIKLLYFAGVYTPGRVVHQFEI